jgi:purine-binding chemotaxis protein CheW
VSEREISTADPGPPPDPKAGEEAETQIPFLVFTLGTGRHALELSRVREVLRHRRPARLPHVRPFLEGVIVVRGEVMPVVDLRQRLGIAPAEPEAPHRLVVVAATDGALAALRVDEVIGVRHLPAKLAAHSGAPGAPARVVTVDGVLTRLIEVDTLLEWGESGD